MGVRYTHSVLPQVSILQVLVELTTFGARTVDGTAVTPTIPHVHVPIIEVYPIVKMIILEEQCTGDICSSFYLLESFA